MGRKSGTRAERDRHRRVRRRRDIATERKRIRSIKAAKKAHT
jgi:hypothetical protein